VAQGRMGTYGDETEIRDARGWCGEGFVVHDVNFSSILPSLLALFFSSSPNQCVIYNNQDDNLHREKRIKPGRRLQ
jgi:hypothetical protein